MGLIVTNFFFQRASRFFFQAGTNETVARDYISTAGRFENPPTIVRRGNDKPSPGSVISTFFQNLGLTFGNAVDSLVSPFSETKSREADDGAKNAAAVAEFPRCRSEAECFLNQATGTGELVYQKLSWKV